MSKYAIFQTCYALCTCSVLCVFCVLHALMMNASAKALMTMITGAVRVHQLPTTWFAIWCVYMNQKYPTTLSLLCHHYSGCK